MKITILRILLILLITIQSNFLNAQTTWTSANSNLSTVDWTTDNLTVNSNLFVANGLGTFVRGYQSGYTMFGKTYRYSAPTVYWSWNKIGQLTSTSSNLAFEVYAKDDYNYADYGLYIVQASRYSTSNYNIAVDRIGGTNNIGFKATIDSDGNVWVYAECSWNNFAGFRCIANNSGTAYTTNIEHTETHPSITMECVPGQFFRATLSGGIFTKSPGSTHYGFTSPYYDSNGNVGIGTTNTANYKLAVEGTIGAREVTVNTDTWSDFVFQDDYKLQSLSEVESFIKDNKHLPDIPSEAEVKENGVSLGEMDAKLLQKIEELTLYVIEINKRTKKLESENKELRNKLYR
jgi:hypothetical protein